MLQSPIGRVASQPMRNIETFPSKHMYLYLSLVERKVAEFYYNMVKMTYFHRFLQTIPGVLFAGIRVEEITVAEVFQVKGGRSPVSKKRLVLNEGRCQKKN